MISSFDRMKSVQSTLNSLTGKTDTVETQETSGHVTAVTSDNEAEPDETDAAGIQADDADSQKTEDSQNDSSDADSQNEDESGQNAADTQTSDGGTSSSENGSDGVYIVEKGDTLAIISRKMYGEPFFHRGRRFPGGDDHNPTGSAADAAPGHPMER